MKKTNKRSSVKADQKQSTFEKVTQRVIDALESNSIPWKKSWKSIGESSIPYNFISKKPYRGINLFLTGFLTDYTSSAFITKKQLEKIGGELLEDAVGTEIVYFNYHRKTSPCKCLKGKKPNPVCKSCDGTGEVSFGVPFFRFYKVYNLDEVTGIEIPEEKDLKEFPIKKRYKNADKIVKDYKKVSGVKIRHSGNRAFYSPSKDSVTLPKFEQFVTSEDYYSVSFHELVHSTGHQSRLNRNGVSKPHFFGDEEYSKEELIAELGASFLSAHVGISNESLLNSSTAYIKGWLKVLKADSTGKFIWDASMKAQKGVDLILGLGK